MKEEVQSYLISLPFNTLSFFGSGFVILLYIIAKPLRIYAFKLILLVSINDFMRSIILLVPTAYYKDSIDGSILCSCMGFVFAFTIIGTAFWMFAISYTMFQVMVLKKENIENYFYFWFFMILSYQMFVCIFLLLTDSYGFDNNTCVLKNNHAVEFYMLFFYFLPIWIEIFSIIGISLAIYYKISKNKEIKSQNIGIMMLIRFPVILMFCVLPMNLNIIFSFFDIKSLVLIYSSICLYSIHGFLNALAYAFTQPVLKYLRKRLRRSEVTSFSQLVN